MADYILPVHLVSKDGGAYCVRCPHCKQIIGIAGDDLSEIRGEQFQHRTRAYPGRRSRDCAGWLEVDRDARFVKELPAPAPTADQGRAGLSGEDAA